ncbi:MAG TPA: DUF1152 domain-containing protein [Fimbriimonas sp.]|nr:DUF1152 domain-containing protein [Fimbriimonas sp.]
MKLFENPISTNFAESSRVLVMGAGGGFDIFAGLPIAFALESMGKEVVLANLSFSEIPDAAGPLGRVDADTRSPYEYFPELYLSRWFREQGREVPVYCLAREGFARVYQRMLAIVEETGVDSIVLVDGGTDILMRGDEAGLGTPHEDIVSLLAASEFPFEKKLVACVGFGVDRYHGVCHAQFLEGVAELSIAGAYLGSFSLLNDMPEAAMFRSALSFTHEYMPENPSIVNSAILASMEGKFAYTTVARGASPWLSPLMGIYWCFDLNAVAKRVRYAKNITKTRTFTDVLRVIASHDSRREAKPWEDIPI